MGHAALCGLMTMFALLLPWFVAHGAGDAADACSGGCPAGVRWRGAADLVVVKGYGVARLRLATTGVLVVLMFFLYGVGPFSAFPAFGATKRVIHLLDRAYSARPLADRLALLAPPDETVAVFRVRRDMEYGLAFYRNREVVNYEETGVPDEEHLLVARVTGRRGVDLHTPAALQEYLEGRHYEQILSWPEQGLEVYLVGAR